MNEISFKLKKELLELLKRAMKIYPVNDSLLIKTDETKQIIFIFINLKKSPETLMKQGYASYPTGTLVEEHFTAFKKSMPLIKEGKKANVERKGKKDRMISEKKESKIIPIFIPPIDDYEVTILLKENILKMKSDKMRFEFPLDNLEKYLEENLPLQEMLLEEEQARKNDKRVRSESSLEMFL